MGKTSRGNVLMVSNYASDTGYAWWLMEHFWTLLANHFVSSGGQAFLAYPSINALSPRISNAPIQTIEAAIPGDTPEQRKKVLSFIAQQGITALYFTDRPWFNVDYLALRRHGVDVIVVHDHTPGDRPPINGFKGAIKAVRNRLPGVCADYVFTVSPLMRERSIRNARIPAARCLTVQNGIPPVAGNLTRSQTRCDLGLDDDQIVVIITGRAHPYKRFDFIVRVAARAKTLRPDIDIQFLLVGDGPALASLKELIGQLEMEEHIQLLGFRKDTADLLLASDIAMHAALGEGFSLSILEYMSAGLPVLVPDIPSVSQAVEHNITGLHYAKDDLEEAALQILNLAIDKPHRERLGLAARRVVGSRYSLEKCSEAFKAACAIAYP